MLKDKVAIITGAAQGIGRAIALEFARNRASIVAADILEEKVQELAKEIEANGGKALAMKLNVTELKDCEKTVTETINQYSRIDILVNNAGITHDQLLIRMSEEDWDKVLAVNLKGMFNCCKAACRQMFKQHRGCVINISSIVGITGNVGQANYAASKAGVIGLTKSLAKEFAARNIAVNAIAPGFIKTGMTEALPDKIKEQMLGLIPVGRFGEPEEVARLALFLASDLCSYITGEVIRIDGGLAM